MRERLLPLILAVSSSLKDAGRAIVVIDGMCGAGKTTAAGVLAPLWDAGVLRMDDFFLPPDMRTERRLSEPGGNVHYERFEEQVLRGLSLGGGFDYERYDCAANALYARHMDKRDAYIIEGSYSMHPRFRGAYRALGAITAFMSVDENEQRRRILLRSGPDKLGGFISKWIPLEKTYFEAYHVRESADIAL